ncbi:MAG TPA: hypothetical protein VLJ10_03865 [Candidatus Bathyarchaeia archaeon]|nr:hypothetical protein [Candidatus Bathyarchaeia archaeon]
MFQKPKLHDREELDGLYKERGFQKLSFNEYLLVKKQQSRAKLFRLPPAIQFILTTPFIILFCAGIIFIPYITYQFISAISSQSHAETEKKPVEKVLKSN